MSGAVTFAEFVAANGLSVADADAASMQAGYAFEGCATDLVGRWRMEMEARSVRPGWAMPCSAAGLRPRGRTAKAIEAAVAAGSVAAHEGPGCPETLLVFADLVVSRVRRGRRETFRAERETREGDAASTYPELLERHGDRLLDPSRWGSRAGRRIPWSGAITRARTRRALEDMASVMRAADGTTEHVLVHCGIDPCGVVPAGTAAKATAISLEGGGAGPLPGHGRAAAEALCAALTAAIAPRGHRETLSGTRPWRAGDWTATPDLVVGLGRFGTARSAALRAAQRRELAAEAPKARARIEALIASIARA